MRSVKETKNVWGGVGYAATIDNIGSGDWTILKVAGGTYRIIFNKPFITLPNVLLTVLNGNPAVYTVHIATLARDSVVLFTCQNGTATDNNFMFSATGLR